MRKVSLSFWASLVAVTIMAVVAGAAFFGMSDGTAGYRQNNINTIKETVLSYISQCYALEGAYPPDLDYLSDNYGLRLNREQYIYHYDVFAANIFPSLKVFEKAGG